MSGWSFARTTLLNARSPACLWRHPAQALRIVAGAVQNVGLAASERLAPSGRHECPVCGWQGRRFRTFLSADEVIPHCMCPHCLSFDRHRLLVMALQEELERNRGSLPRILLGFSLSAALRLWLEKAGLPGCYCTDIAVDDRRFVPDFVSDLRRTAVAGGVVDWLFCSHVLEHVPELNLCLDEIDRLLSPGGLAWIQVPCEPDLQHSVRIRVDPLRAHAHAWRFGQDFGRKLARPDWGVREIVAERMLEADACRRYGIDPRERLWLVRKA